MKRQIIIFLLIAILLLTATAQANGIPNDVSIWAVIGGGGGPVAAGAFALDATIGQPVVGFCGCETSICSGYWCGTDTGGVAFLPVVLKYGH